MLALAASAVAAAAATTAYQSMAPKAQWFGRTFIGLPPGSRQIALTYDFKNRPKAEDIFTSQYLPPAAERKL